MSEAGKSPASPTPPLPSGTPVPAPPQATSPAQISIEEFQKIALRVGVITAAEDHPNADRLVVLKVDLGDGAPPRQLVAGIKTTYQPSELVGKHVVVVANLKPAMLRGIESQGMVLAASDGQTIILLTPERPIRAGSTVK